MSTNSNFRIDEWEVFSQQNELRRGSKICQLEPKVMDLLVYLAEHSDEVLSKERLIQAVWPDAFVADDVLTSAIWKLRQALGDDPKNPSYIRTVPRRGYRLIAEPAFSEVEEESNQRFEILHELGRGAMSDVHLARDTDLGRKVALKFLLPEMEGEEIWARRLRREARAAASLDHPFICKVYDTGTLDGRSFIAMEYVEGETLKNRLKQGPLPVKEALRIASEMAEALEVAHRNGIIHRDIKPSNIMLTQQGHVKITDFGIAKRIRTGDGEELEWTATMTQEASSIGTLPYMSPEQVKGQPLDQRSDVFSFGVVFYEMVAGFNPFFRPGQAETTGAVLHEEPAALKKHVPECDELLQDFVNKLLAKRPEDRYRKIGEASERLLYLRDKASQGPPKPDSWKRHWPAAASPNSILVMAAVLIASISLIWWGITSGSDTAPDQQPAQVLEITPLTFDRGNKGRPRLSPDGKRVAFDWIPNGQSGGDIYVKQIGPNTGVLRLTDHPADESGAEWSPDGEELAFVRNGPDRTMAIYTMPWLGGQEEKVIDLAGYPWGQHHTYFNCLSWSPDGKTMAYGEKPSAEEPARIVLFDLNSRKKRILTHPPASTIDDLAPRFSPDGGRLAFVRALSQLVDQDIWILDIESGETVQVTFQRYERCSSLNWTPDGKELIFSAGTLRRERVYRLKLGEGVPTLLSGLGPGEFQCSLAGDRMVVVRASGGDPINIWSAPGRLADRTGRSQPLIRSEGIDSNMAFSPDSQKIAVTSTRNGDSLQIWITDRNGGNPYQLTDLASAAWTPSWSPDGGRISFSSGLSGNPDIYVVDIESRRTRQITTDQASDAAASFSRDGRWIYFSSNRSGEEQIWKMPSEGGEAIQVTRQGGFFALESSDEKYLYYSKSFPSTSIWRVPVDGGEEIEVIAGPIGWRDWDLGPEGIYYPEVGQGAEPGVRTYRIHYLDLKTGNKTQILREEERGGYMWLAVPPDESMVIFSKWEPWESDLVLVENFQ